MTTTIPAGWKLVPASLYDLVLTVDLEALLWQLKGVREAESVRMALYSARQAILDAEEYSDGTPCAAPGVSTVEDERQAFEAWAEDQGFVLDCDFFEVSGQYYDQDDTQLAYDIWRAARASVAAPAAGDALDALRELVECDSLKKRIASMQVCVLETEDDVQELDAMMSDLARRQPAAWDAARAALAAQRKGGA